MKVLWIVNMVLPDVAAELNLKTSVSGGWLVDYANRLSKMQDVELATMTYANVDKNIDKQACNIRNFIFAGGGKRLLLTSKKTSADCEYVINEFKPDIIHIHGTEYSMGYSMLKVNEKYNIPVVLTIQGVLTRISEEYCGGLSFFELLKMSSIKEWLKLKNPVFAKKLFKKNAKREQEVLKKVKYVTGRTTWDKATMLSINNKLTYYRFNYNLRKEFYEADKWSYDQMEPHTVYMCAAGYPLKGMHIMIKAIKLVKEKFPDVKLYVPGGNYKDGKPVNVNGYERYILRKIKEYGIEENVHFLGGRSAKEVAQIVSKVNVCAVSSAMEGASATICEAMMLGTPCICTYRGGMTDLLRDGESGFYYDFPEYSVLAERICTLFSERKLCEQFSEATKKDAAERHNREKNIVQLISIYNEIIDKEKVNE